MTLNPEFGAFVLCIGVNMCINGRTWEFELFMLYITNGSSRALNPIYSLIPSCFRALFHHPNIALIYSAPTNLQ